MLILKYIITIILTGVRTLIVIMVIILALLFIPVYLASTGRIGGWW